MTDPHPSGIHYPFWTTLPALPEGYLWNTEIDGEGTRYLQIRDANLWWISAGREVHDDDLLDAAARCLDWFNKPENVERRKDVYDYPPAYSNRFGVQPCWR